MYRSIYEKRIEAHTIEAHAHFLATGRQRHGSAEGYIFYLFFMR